MNLSSQTTDDPPNGNSVPEVATLTDEQPVVAIELADLREPGLNLHAVGDLPDRHKAFLHGWSAELVRQLEQQGCRSRREQHRSQHGRAVRRVPGGTLHCERRRTAVACGAGRQI